ncbi:RDD family protein [Paucibacter sp. TC2R-5]|uniref:RDD family protein n=1 Tax=Paucibacter sp. TC2R-5 TaxID=2893555 RepID=UPI0021E381A0|nr:RDD family protein [Paucibacter sp. TC2R-5]MCV2361017.1 RDD family protein [Paucibacter sp. TC2R-5]
MPATANAAPKFDPRAWVTPDDLNVAPALLGLPLAKPRQRLFAMAADMALLAMANKLGNFWLLLAAGLALWLWVRRYRPEVFGRSRWFGRKTAQQASPWAWALVAVFAVGGLVQAWQSAGQLEEPQDGTVHSLSAAASGLQDLDEAGPSAQQDAKQHAKLEALKKAQAERIERLEAQLERARAPAFYAVQDELNYWADKIGLSYFWAAVYFTLLPIVWPGQTPGKRIMGLQVIELTGKHLTPLILFKRFGGYAAGLATGGTGFVQLIWDSNRQAIQDKTAHTVVINARSSARLNELLP